jgi:hypothetical protein
MEDSFISGLNPSVCLLQGEKVYKESQNRPERCPYCGALLSDVRFHVFGPDGKIICPTQSAAEGESILGAPVYKIRKERRRRSHR